MEEKKSKKASSLKVTAEIQNLKDFQDLVNQLTETVKEASSLMDELASFEFKVDIS